MTTAQVVETSVSVNNNSPTQDYVHLDDQMLGQSIESRHVNQLLPAVYLSIIHSIYKYIKRLY